jgi:hypothetical protein
MHLSSPPISLHFICSPPQYLILGQINSAGINAATFPQLFMPMYLCMANRICFTDKNSVRKWKLLLRYALSNGVDKGDILPTKFNSFMPLPSPHFI